LCISRYQRNSLQYYIDAWTGNDDHSGLTPDTAFRTIQRGIDAARDGHTVIVFSITKTHELIYRSASSYAWKETRKNLSVN
jgi:hypothetical protein